MTHILEQPWEDTPAQREAAAAELRRMDADLYALLGSGKPRTVMALRSRLMWMAYPEQRDALEEVWRAQEEAERSDLNRLLAKLVEQGVEYEALGTEEGDASAEPQRLFWRCGGPATSGWSTEDVHCAIVVHPGPHEEVLFFDCAEDLLGYSSVQGGKHVFHQPQQSW